MSCFPQLTDVLATQGRSELARQQAAGVRMAELALADVDPGGQGLSVGSTLRGGQVAQARIVQRLDASGTSAVAILAHVQSTTGDEPPHPVVDVLGKPTLARVVTVLIVREIQRTTQATTGVAEVEILFE